jgi:hypothetical protein
MEQKTDLQLRALRKGDCRKIFQEKVSGAARARPELQRMSILKRYNERVMKSSGVTQNRPYRVT